MATHPGPAAVVCCFGPAACRASCSVSEVGAVPTGPRASWHLTCRTCLSTTDVPLTDVTCCDCCVLWAYTIRTAPAGGRWIQVLEPKRFEPKWLEPNGYGPISKRCRNAMSLCCTFYTTTFRVGASCYTITFTGFILAARSIVAIYSCDSPTQILELRMFILV